MAGGKSIVWAKIDPETPQATWWPKLLAEKKWPEKLLIERWAGAEMAWGPFVDSFRTFSLFGQPKVFFVNDADKALKSLKNSDDVLASLEKGPHRVVFISAAEKPKNLEIPVWEMIGPSNSQKEDRSSFQWIDAIHAGNLDDALRALDRSLAQDQHPLALLQLLTRDFRLGRLIGHAVESRLKEVEISGTLKVAPFIVQKWMRRKSISKSHWIRIFDRLLETDLELKSGADGLWALRKLTLDLVQSQNPKAKKIKKPSRQEPLLWPAVPSFA